MSLRRACAWCVGTASFASRRQCSLQTAAVLLTAGIIAFCGSLYLLAFQITLGSRLVVGVATPLGGILLISGWLMFAVSSWRARRAG